MTKPLRVTICAGFSVLLMGCETTGSPQPSLTPQVAFTSDARRMAIADEERKEKAHALRRRMQVVLERLKEVSKLDPDPANDKEAERFYVCLPNECREEAEASKSRGALSARALAKIFPHSASKMAVGDEQILEMADSLAEAEDLSQKALDMVKEKIVSDKFRAEDEKKKGEDFERAGIARMEGAAKPCSLGIPACKAACEGKEEFALEACVLLANALSEEAKPDLAKVRALYERACEGKVPIACKMLPKVGQIAEAADRKKDEAFENAKKEGDDLATKKYIVKALESMGGFKQLRAAKAMRAQMAAAVKEAYCPAKKEAISALGQKEFSSRVAKHCEEDPPTTQGLSGRQVELKAECKTTFATACP